MRRLRQKEIELDAQAGWCAVPYAEFQAKSQSLIDRGMIVTAVDVEPPKPLHPGCYRIYYVPKANTYTYDEREKHVPQTSTSIPGDFVRHIHTDSGRVSDKPSRRTIAASRKDSQLELI